MDPIILSRQIPPPCPGDRILDIGCGCGIIPVILGYCFPQSFITGIEIQNKLAEVAYKNVLNNKLEQTVSIINQDMKTVDIESSGGLFDLILSNPPYKKLNTGRLNPENQKAIARHEIAMDIKSLAEKAEILLKQNGRLIIIFPAERLKDILGAMQSTSISPEWIRYIFTRQNKPPKRVIFSGQKNGIAPYRVLPPVYLTSHDMTGMNILPKRINP